MGIDIVIGVLEDKYVKFEELTDSPVAKNSWMKPHVNSLSMTISGWHRFVCSVGLFNLVESDQYGNWSPGLYEIRDVEFEKVLEAYETFHSKPSNNVVPDYKGATTEVDAAILNWFMWWVLWAMNQGRPAYIQVNY